jgi:hypothetical protein
VASRINAAGGTSGNSTQNCGPFPRLMVSMRLIQVRGRTYPSSLIFDCLHPPGSSHSLPSPTRAVESKRRYAIPVLCLRHPSAIFLPQPYASDLLRFHFPRAIPLCNPWNAKYPQPLAHGEGRRKVQDDLATCNDGVDQPRAGTWDRHAQGIAQREMRQDP